MEHILQAQNTVAKKSELIINTRQWQLLKNILLLALLCASYSYFAYPKFMDVGYPQIGYEADTIAVEEVTISVEIPDEASRVPGEKIEIIYADPALLLSELNPYYEDGRLTVLGSVTNDNNYPLESAVIHASLYDESGAKIYECDNGTGVLNANGGTGDFSVLCGCSKNPVPSFASMQLAVR